MISRALLSLLAALTINGAPASAQPSAGDASASSPRQAWPQAASDIPTDPAVRYGTLPNGMRYAVRHNATPAGQTSLRLRIGAGSIQEGEDQRGLAHFIEHMVFNGSTHVPEGEFVRRLERHGLRFGPDTNASTEFDQTVYKLDLPDATPSTVDEGLFLLREVASEVTFAPAAIDRERGIIQSEERSRATPQYRIITDQFGYLMPGQRLPTRWPIGLPAVVAGAQRDRFVRFYDAYYRPERTTLIAVGDFNVDEMEARIRTQFGSWRGRGSAGADPDLGSVAQRSGGVHVYLEPGGPSQISLNWVRPPDLRPDTRARRAEKLADSLALLILNRRLERVAATQAPPPFVAAQGVRSDIVNSANLTQLVAVTQPGEWQRALVSLETELRRLMAFGVTSSEVNRELAELRTALIAQASGAATRQSAALADALVATSENDDVFASPAETLRLFEAVSAGLTPERVNQSARALFAGEPRLYLSSPQAVEGGEVSGVYREATAAPLEARRVEQAVAWPYTTFGQPGRVTERRALPIDAVAIRFANGTRLTVKHTDFADDEVLVSVRFGGGQLDLPVDRPNPDWGLAAGLEAGGLGRISFEDMQEALASRVFGASLGIDENRFQLSGATRPGDLAVQLQVLAAYMADPGWRDAGWNRLCALSATIHDQLASTPGGTFSRDSGVLLHSGDRRWSTPSREQMAASSIADARAVLEGPLAHAPIEVIIVGDVDVEEAIRQTAATFGALAPRSEQAGRVEPVRFPAATPQPVRLTHRGRADQGLAFIAWLTQGFYDDPHQARVLYLLAAVYQLRLLQTIREEQGTTYSPQANHSASDAYRGYGLFFGRIEARPEALSGFLRDAETIAADLRAQPVGADEMQRARLPLLDALMRARQGNQWWLDSLEDVQTNPGVLPALQTQIADYRTITPADLQLAAREFLIAGRAWKAIVVPEATAP